MSDDDCKQKSSLNSETVYMILAIAAFVISELLPFVESFCGIEIKGNGLLHIIKGLLTNDLAIVQEGLDQVSEN